MVIRIISPNEPPKNIKISNSFLLNRASFSFMKRCVGVHYMPIYKVEFEDVRPFITAVNEYAKNNPEFIFLEVLSKNGNKVLISF